MQQVLGLYNYWIVIFLMMTGFYIVIARTNLIQKVIGLNIFQISVFLLYITMGKVTGGTAPILQGHGAEHAEHGGDHHAMVSTEPLHSPPGRVGLSGPVREKREHALGSDVTPDAETHEAELLANSDQHTTATSTHAAPSPLDSSRPSRGEGEVGHTATEDDHTHHAQLYSHPLPSVLMLTAIVVGVATTSVALALIIRIGEAYGTIEEDEILQKDREAS